MECARQRYNLGNFISPVVGVSNKHRLVNLYLCALGPDGALKDTRFRLNVPTSSLLLLMLLAPKMVRSKGYKWSREGLVPSL